MSEPKYTIEQLEMTIEQAVGDSITSTLKGNAIRASYTSVAGLIWGVAGVYFGWNPLTTIVGLMTIGACFAVLADHRYQKMRRAYSTHELSRPKEDLQFIEQTMDILIKRLDDRYKDQGYGKDD